MVRTVKFFIVPFIFLLIFSSPVSSFGAETIQLTNDGISFDIANPDINADGEIIWTRYSWAGFGHTDVMLYDGDSIGSLTEGFLGPLGRGYDFSNPDLNDNGQATWRGRDVTDPYHEGPSYTNNIFFYDGQTVNQITDILPFGPTTYMGDPLISNNGEIVWTRMTTPVDENTGLRWSKSEIFFHDGGNVSQLTDGPVNMSSFSPSISNSGNIAWLTENTDGSEDVYFYKDGLIQQITNDTYDDYAPKVNSSGEIAWLTLAGPSAGVNLYDGTQINHLVDFSPEDIAQNQGFWLDINDAGQVVWNSRGDIFLFDGTGTLQLTSTPDWDDTNPHINADGKVAWESLSLDRTEGQILLYNGSDTKRVDTEIDTWIGTQSTDISDNGDVVWIGVETEQPHGSRIFLYDANLPPPPPDDGFPDTALVPDEGILPDDRKDIVQVQLPDAHLDYDAPLDPDKSTIVIVHGMNGHTRDWVTTMENSLEARIGTDDYNIVKWDWEKEASTILKGTFLENIPLTRADGVVLNTAKKQGNLLADELIAGNYTKELHIIGHSAGGTVIDQAAKVLDGNGIKVSQLTFLDAPNFYDLSGLITTPFDATTAEWADNYPSEIGSRDISGAYDFHLALFDHAYPHEFYNTTILAPLETDPELERFMDKGFYWSKAGGGWEDKPDRNGQGFELGDVLQDIKQKVETSFTDTVVTIQVSIEKTYADARLEIERITTTVETRAKETFDAVGNWLREKQAYLQDGFAKFFESSPAYLFQDVTIPEDATHASFDFLFATGGDGDYLATHFNDEPLFWFEGTKFYGEDFWNTGLIDISQYAGQTGTWTFGLESVGDPNAELWIDNLAFYNVRTSTEIIGPSVVPEPSTLALLGVGLIGFVFRGRRRNGIRS